MDLQPKIGKLKEEMQRLVALKVRMLATPDQQISLTDPDARPMATSGRGFGVVGYNVQGRRRGDGLSLAMARTHDLL